MGAAALAVAAVAATALAGCGGGGGSTGGGTPTSGGAPGATTSSQGATTGTGSDSSNPFGGSGAAEGHTVGDVLEAVLTTGDPDKACSTDYVTEQYLSDAYGGEQGCVQAQTPKSAAQSLDVVSFSGDSGNAGTATLEVAVHGGIYDGEKITVSIVKEGDDWKIDSLKSNAPVGP